MKQARLSHSAPAALRQPGHQAVGPWPAHPLLRLAFWLEVAFGLAAVLTLTLDPAGTAQHFAWTLKPPATAAAIGAFYAAVAPSMLLAACARHWHEVRVMVLPTVVFTASQLVVTLLHWDRFHHGSPAFAVWWASYLLPPFWMSWAWWWHQRQAQPVPPSAPVARRWRWALLVLGLLLAAEGLLGLVWPGWLTQGHAITFTPLSARVASGWLLALGAVLVSMALEGDARRMRVAAPFAVLVLPLMALQLWCFGAEVDVQHPRLWAGALVMALASGLTLRCVWTGWRQPTAAGTTPSTSTLPVHDRHGA